MSKLLQKDRPNDLKKDTKKKRPIGLAHEDFSVPKSFLGPLPTDVLRRFNLI